MPKVKKHKTVLAAKQTLSKPAKTANKPSTGPKHKSQPPAAWKCASIIDQQSAEALSKLITAAETRSAGATIKSLTLAPHIVHKKPTFAVTVETLKFLPLLKQLLADVGLLEQHKQLSPSAGYVLTYELLFGQGFRTRGPAETAILNQQAQLQSALQALLQQAGVADAAAWLQQQQHPQQQQQRQMVPHPRFARVNTLKASVAQVLAQLHGGEQAKPAGKGGSSSKGSSSKTRPSFAGGDGAGGSSGVVIDGLLPDVLVFPPGTDLHDHPLVEAGVLILQSKASCMPAHALCPQAGWHVVDCCAAPGNKTTHVAALLAAANSGSSSNCKQAGNHKDGSSSSSSKKRKAVAAAEQQPSAAAAAAAPGIKVFAFDKDPKRLRRLQGNIARTGADGIVVARQADFLTLNPAAEEFAQVRGVILDPSCSGSGTVVSRMDHLLPQATQTPAVDVAAAAGAEDEASAGGAAAAGDGSSTAEQQRVEQLAKFQEAAVLHALKFPSLQRLVYSTCSIHQRENEDVVAAVLPAAAAAGFGLVDPFPAWQRRGLPVVAGAELLVRTDPYLDGTDGFFVAVFERQQ